MQKSPTWPTSPPPDIAAQNPYWEWYPPPPISLQSCSRRSQLSESNAMDTRFFQSPPPHRSQRSAKYHARFAHWGADTEPPSSVRSARAHLAPPPPHHHSIPPD